VELLGGDGELDRRLRALPGRVPQLDQGGGQDAVAGIALDLEQGLAHLRGEGGDVDQPDDVIGVGGGVGDHGAAVGVADGNDRAGDLRNRAGDIRRVVGDTAQRVGGGDDRDAGGEEALDDAVPTGGVGEGAVDEDDGRGGAGGGGGVGHGVPSCLVAEDDGGRTRPPAIAAEPAAIPEITARRFTISRSFPSRTAGSSPVAVCRGPGDRRSDRLSPAVPPKPPDSRHSRARAARGLPWKHPFRGGELGERRERRWRGLPNAPTGGGPLVSPAT
jgi:hypothetical protein